MDYVIAERLRAAGVSQKTRKHINEYGKVFWTRRETIYPAYPKSEAIQEQIEEMLEKRFPGVPEYTIGAIIKLMKYGAIGCDETDKLAGILLNQAPPL